MNKRLKKHDLLVALATLIGILFIALGIFYMLVTKDESMHSESQTTGLKNEIYANVDGKKVKTFMDCKNAGGILRINSSIDYCYFEEVKYYEVPRKGLEDLNPPEYLRSYTDCVRPGNSVDVSSEKLSCTSWNGKTYYYTGTKVDSFEDCAKVMGFVMESNPPQCYGPDGTHFFGQRN